MYYNNRIFKYKWKQIRASFSRIKKKRVLCSLEKTITTSVSNEDEVRIPHSLFFFNYFNNSKRKKSERKLKELSL